MAKEHYIIPIFVPHKGCPFDCVFCNQKKITGFENEICLEQISYQIENYIRTIKNPQNKHVEIAFFGGSFTGIEKNVQKDLLMIAWKWKQIGLVKDIRISTRPDYINYQIMDLLSRYGVSIIELGVQSMDSSVLIASGRGHTSEDVIKAVRIIKQFPVKLGLQMMIGLPKDNFQKVQNSADMIIQLRPDFVRIYPTLVVKETHLEKLYRTKQYCPLSLKEAVHTSKILLLKFIKEDIQVIRIGLQPTENILLGREVVAGPFHPSFRQWVETEIFKDILNKLFIQFDIRNKESVVIQVNDRFLSSLVGHKKNNIYFLKKNYRIKKIKIIRNNQLKEDKIKIFPQSEREITYSIKQYANSVI